MFKENNGYSRKPMRVQAKRMDIQGKTMNAQGKAYICSRKNNASSRKIMQSKIKSVSYHDSEHFLKSRSEDVFQSSKSILFDENNFRK
eukprot:UN21650